MMIKTDYWKSQDRKFCDFCKCWITDNKPSVQFHENGKRHKENVAKKISELTKKSAKAQKESKKVDEEMKKMEEAALKAYMKDIETNPDFTSLQYKQIQEEKSVAQQQEVKEIVKNIVGKTKCVPDSNIVNEAKTVPAKKVWYEAKTDEGHTYYWNTETNESVWEPPEEGFLSLKDQKKAEEAAAKLKEAQENEAKEAAERMHKQKEKEASEEARAYAAREEMKKFRKTEVKEIEELPGPILGPAPKVDPYGAWTAIEKTHQEPVNWQLPQVPRPIEIPAAVVNEPKVKIKEKKIDSLGDLDSNVPPVFKKRKPNPNRGNIRQRLDDD